MLQQCAITLRDRRNIIGTFLFETSSFNSCKRMRLHTMKGLSDGCRPLRGLDLFFWRVPGAYAPGFMLTPAPRGNHHPAITRAHPFTHERSVPARSFFPSSPSSRIAYERLRKR